MARHHGDTLSPNQRSRSLRTAVITREIIPVPHRRPGTSTAPASAPPGPAPDAHPSRADHPTPHTTMSRCASMRQVNTTVAASNPTTPPPQRRRPNRGAPLRAAPTPGPAAPSHCYRRGAPPGDHPYGPRGPSSPCCRAGSRAPQNADLSLTRTHAVLLQPCSALTHGASSAPSMAAANAWRLGCITISTPPGQTQNRP